MIATNAGRERTQAPIAMAVSALMMAHQVAGKAARDAIFLSQFSASDLPAMVAVAAIAAVAISIAGGRMLVRMGPYRIAASSFALSAVLQSAEWLLLGYRPRIAACAIYLHVVAFGAVLLSGFWSVMNESFEPRSARSVFGKISGMGTLGGLCGGLLAERVAAQFAAADVVLLLAVLHLACAALLWRSFPAATSVTSNKRSETHQTHETSVIDAVQRYPFLLTLAGLVLAASASTALLDFVFKAQAAHTIGSHSSGQGASLLRFFGLYYTATSLLTFLVQTFLTKVVLQHAGLAACAAALPATTAVGSLVSLLVPGFRILSGVRATELMMRGSLYRAAYELFYTAVAPAEKRAVKSMIDVGADRAGDAVGAAATSLLLVLTPGRYGSILALASGVSVIASLLAIRLQRGYLHALEKSLVERATELDPALVEDPATRTFFMQSIVIPRLAQATANPEPAHAATSMEPAWAPMINDSFVRRAAELRSGDVARTVRAAGELGRGDSALAPLLIDLLAWDEAMPAARNALEQLGPRITGMLIDALLDAERDFVVRRRVPRVLAFLPSMRTVDGLLEALADQRFEVRFYSARALYWLAKNRADLTIAPDRVWAAVNRELSLQRSVWNSHGLLDRRASHETQWFFDEELQDRADLNLEHLFTLLALLLPVDAVRIAFRALHTDDRQLKGTAFEYLESATPPDTRQLLLPLLEADAESRVRSGAVAPPAAIDGQDGALRNLLESKARINQTLKLTPLRMEARQ